MMQPFNRGLWAEVSKWGSTVPAAQGIFRTKDGVWVVTSPELAHQVLVEDACSYPVKPAFLRVKRHTLPNDMRTETVHHLLKLMGAVPSCIDAAAAEAWLKRPQNREFQGWGIRLTREIYRSALSVDRPTLVDAALDRFVDVVLVDGTARGRRFNPTRRTFALLQRQLASEFVGNRMRGSAPRDLIDIVNRHRPFLAPHDCAEVYLRLVTALLGATGIAIEWMIALASEGGPSLDFSDIATMRRASLETQRLYPSSWRLYREAGAEGSIGGHRVRKGDHVIIATYAIHRDSECWPHPEAYMPDRWLRDPIKRPSSYLPFSEGPGACPGRGVAAKTIASAAQLLLANFQPTPAFIQGAQPQALALLSPPRGVLRLGLSR